jgi:pilus assembly protein Flp/PilA
VDTIYTMIARIVTGDFEMLEYDEDKDVGAGIVEYALLVAFIALIAGVGILVFGNAVSTFFSGLGTKLGF